MEVKLQFPDSIYAMEAGMWDMYFQALQLMANRMAMSYPKYHAARPLADLAHEEDNMTFSRQRMAMYDGRALDAACDCGAGAAPPKQHSISCFTHLRRAQLNSGNTENCIDAANGQVIEHMYPNHPKAHFRSQGSHESPGIVYTEGC